MKLKEQITDILRAADYDFWTACELYEENRPYRAGESFTIGNTRFTISEREQ